MLLRIVSRSFLKRKLAVASGDYVFVFPIKPAVARGHGKLIEGSLSPCCQYQHVCSKPRIHTRKKPQAGMRVCLCASCGMMRSSCADNRSHLCGPQRSIHGRRRCAAKQDSTAMQEGGVLTRTHTYRGSIVPASDM